MSMKFYTNDRPSNDLQQKLREENTPLSIIPFPKNNIEEPCVNFQEVLASERYKDIIDNFRKYCNTTATINGGNILQLMMMMMNDHLGIVQIERNHREELSQLAVELVCKEMGIPEGSFIFDAKIIGQEEMNTSNFQHGEQEKRFEVDIDEEDIPLNNGDELEIAKRRLINAIIQGSSKRGHYMYQIVEESVKQIVNYDNIIEMYGRMMSINDSLYWQLNDQMMKQLGGSDGEASVAGKEEVDRNTTPPTIYARGVNFPVLIHELIKGIMEVFAIHGLPENYENFKDDEDTIENEMWDLRLGPSIWKRLRSQFPTEIILDDDKVELQNFLIVEIFKLPAEEFLHFMRDIMDGNDDGKRKINELMAKVNNRDNEIDDDEDLDE